MAGRRRAAAGLRRLRNKLDGPGDRLLKAVVAPEQSAIPRGEARRAEQAARSGFVGVDAQSILHRPIALGALRNGLALSPPPAGGLTHADPAGARRALKATRNLRALYVARRSTPPSPMRLA